MKDATHAIAEQPIEIRQPEPPATTVIVADVLKTMSEGIRRLQEGSGLNRKAIVVLLSDETKVKRTTIKTVLDGMESLHAKYCGGA